ncbi:glycosyltransferase [Candidatus Dependentiae bacterium]|nr:glycosyltransferase [Candidatus Dependentiae bacterium]
MAKILIFTTELTSISGLSTGGRGIRIQNLINGLKLHNHNVITSFLAENIAYIETQKKIKVPEEYKIHCHQYEYSKIITEINPDVIIFSPWTLAISYNNKKFKNIPVVIDMPGMLTLENIYDKTEENFFFLAKKIYSLNKADLFCISNPRQKYFLYPLLIMAGADLKKKPLIQVPISYSDDIPEHKSYPSPPVFVFSGILWKWQNYGDSLNVIADYISKSGGKLDLFCGNFIYKKEDRSLDNLKKNKSVNVNGLVDHDILIEKYLQSSAAIELYLPNPERELATTTRTFEYFWSGLPVIYSKGMFLAEFIKEYDAGWVVDPANKNELINVLEEITTNPEICKTKGTNAQKLLKEKFNNYASTSKLSEFCSNPKKLNNKNNFISFLSEENIKKSDKIRHLKNTVLSHINNEISLKNKQNSELISENIFLKKINKELETDLTRIKNRLIFRSLLKIKKIFELIKDLILLKK